MALNSQHKRVSKNRVSITYDVETNGALETKELPFVVGVIGDYSGHKPESEKISLEDREFIGIDKDNFDSVMAKVDPQLTYKVENVLLDDESEIEVSLKFNNIKDFHPERVVKQVEPLNKLVETRNQLKVLLSKADRSRELEKCLKQILQDSNALKGLADELGVATTTDKADE